MREHEYWNIKHALETALIEGDHIEGCSASGAVDDAVAYALEDAKVQAILAPLEADPGRLIAELLEYGAWEENELASSHERCFSILIWNVACDYKENNR